MMEWYYERMTMKKVILYKGERDLASDSTDSFSQASEAHPPIPPNATQPPLSFYSDTDYHEILIIVTFFYMNL